MRLCLASALGLLSYLAGVWGQDSAIDGMQNARNIQREQLERMQDFLGPPPPPPPTKPGTGKGSTVTFKNPAAKQFLVDGTKIPEGMIPDFCAASHAHLTSQVNFDAGPSWSGLMPISGAKNETRKLFFW